MLQKFHTFDLLEAGTDEAGRGCLAGPVTAVAVILNLENIDQDDFFHSINDSKQLNEKMSRGPLRSACWTLKAEW